jgi:hypothetical protein
MVPKLPRTSTVTRLGCAGALLMAVAACGGRGSEVSDATVEPEPKVNIPQPVPAPMPPPPTGIEGPTPATSPPKAEPAAKTEKPAG